MAWDILGMIAVGIGAAALAFAALHALRKAGLALPRWLLPAAIGLAMLSFTVWNEYSWYSRVRAQLPETVEILQTGTGGKAWRPWAFVVPMVSRFAALDRASLHDTGDGLQRGQVLFVERWQPTRAVTLDFDCGGTRMRAVENDRASDWQSGTNDPAFAAICRKEG
ncbi:hypothetical protein RGQ15_10485 [Paracoccus sp. MBLB3053]|uniref:Uncharacterized protein n=1 Tax=Paracoccus aurantius TaxID=3073814 RepID=A0ABU2HSI2_9RHOB|nr:hypothetical protein [Paracoccus sp. MBLB3053]MDS9467992.1 hypothetical protein [Paracoccus sp. MBLB3053]